MEDTSAPELLALLDIVGMDFEEKLLPKGYSVQSRDPLSMVFSETQ